MINLTGKIALVTGGSRALSRAIALRLAEAGADVILNFAESHPAVNATSEAIAERGRRVAEVLGDAAEPDDVQSMLDWIGETFERIDILVCVAEADHPAELLGIPLDRLDGMAHPARSLVLLIHSALPLFSAGAKVIAVAEGGSADVNALEGAVHQLAGELAHRGIQMNAVRGLTSDDSSGSSKSSRLQTVFGANAGSVQTESAADVVLFLSSNLSDALQGQTLPLGNATPLCRAVSKPV